MGSPPEVSDADHDYREQCGCGACRALQAVQAFSHSGSAESVDDGTVWSYFSVHSRLRRERGMACDLRCADCGEPAAHWSLRKDAQAAVAQVVGPKAGRMFSRDLSEYEPRCGICHARYDGYGGSRNRFAV